MNLLIYTHTHCVLCVCTHIHIHAYIHVHTYTFILSWIDWFAWKWEFIGQREGVSRLGYAHGLWRKICQENKSPMQSYGRGIGHISKCCRMVINLCLQKKTLHYTAENEYASYCGKEAGKNSKSYVLDASLLCFLGPMLLLQPGSSSEKKSSTHFLEYSLNSLSFEKRDNDNPNQQLL